jgi:NDP-sugar pyrophosphorylase family protein
MSLVAETPVAVLAGGLATRLRPITEHIPKVLVSVAGEPFIAHQLRLLRREGIKRVVLCVGYLGEMVRETVRGGEAFGLTVSYSFDGEKLLGTGGALVRAFPQLGDRFIVLYGDSYLDISLAPVLTAFRENRLPALMTVYRNEGRWDTSNVLFDGKRVVRYCKPSPTPDMQYIDYGLGVLTQTAFAGHLDSGAFDLADVYAELAAVGKLAGFEAKHRFYEIGTPAGLAETESYLAQQSS